MNSVRIRRRLDSPIPQLPELTPLVGKEVEIIAVELLDAGGPAVEASVPAVPDQRVRVAGRLVRVLDGGSSFSLLLDTGQAVTASWAGGKPFPAESLLGQRVAIEGAASFSADGSLVRLSAEYAGPASAGDSLFNRLPRPWGRPLDPATLNVPQTPTTGLNAVWDKWPGDESEEEILAALEEADR